MTAARRFVQIGRVVVFVKGPSTGKIAVILDVVDQNRVLVDGPRSLLGTGRRIVRVGEVKLTKYVIPIQRGARRKSLTKAVTESGIQKKWEGSSWNQKIAARLAKENANDFQKFQNHLVRRQRSHKLKVAFAKIKKAAKGGDKKAKAPAKSAAKSKK